MTIIKFWTVKKENCFNWIVVEVFSQQINDVLTNLLMAKTIRMEYPIIARWQKNMTRLHANQPVITAYYQHKCSTGCANKPQTLFE